MWRVRVPASSANLGPGLDTLAMALPLWLECEFIQHIESQIILKGEGADSLPADASNLVWSSAQRVYSYYKHQTLPPGILTINSQIPLGRGLGSSAAAVVAGVFLANNLLSNRLSQEEMLQWAIQIEGHPDNVAAALYGGFVLCWQEASPRSSQDNTLYTHVQKYPVPDLTAIVAIPGFTVSTQKAREILPQSISLHEAIFTAQRVGLWLYALQQKDWQLLRYAAEDQLHQPYREHLNPHMPILFEQAYSAGAVAVFLSGSGPTILALAQEAQRTDIVRQWQALPPFEDHTALTVKDFALENTGAHLF
ncbi:MAG: homoserine kinase [Firmicutes bacterium]|nr:homoserine kinase [Bacillota bacterium]